MTTTAASIPTPDGDLPVRLWLPAAGTGPGIVLCQEIFGISSYVERRAADLAALGYVVAAPEFYWRLGATSVPDGPDMLEQGMALAQQVDWEAAVADGVAAYRWLGEQPQASGKVGLVGFCWGGGLAFNIAAQIDPACLVSYYGSALPSLLELAPRVTCPSLHHFGDADSFIDRPTVERIREAVAAGGQAEFFTYPEADHAFDNPDFDNFHPEAAQIAWGLTESFLSRTLPTGS